jgi:hypothetical protein
MNAVVKFGRVMHGFILIIIKFSISCNCCTIDIKCDPALKSLSKFLNESLHVVSEKKWISVLDKLGMTLMASCYTGYVNVCGSCCGLLCG